MEARDGAWDCGGKKKVSERDQAEIEAEVLLTRFPDSWSPSCREVCNAVAEALRKVRAKVVELEYTIDKADEHTLWLMEEIERLKIKNDEWESLFNSYTRNGATQVVMELRAEIERLKSDLIMEQEARRELQREREL